MLRNPVVGQRLLVAHDFEVENNPDPILLETMHLNHPKVMIPQGVRGAVCDILHEKQRLLVVVELEAPQLHAVSRKRWFGLTIFAKTFVPAG